jgi:class 3 adenylate cyclase/tetratricopeptide (TPR) repeat protein
VSTTVSRCPVCGALNAAEARFCSTCGTALTGGDGSARRETRKTVTVLFADVAGSTALGEALDPESLRAVMTRYFADMKAIIESHGGQVEKFIGDAVMAVFGMPVTHEDDALRAVRAAADIRDRLVSLNIELSASRGIEIRFRTGVNTGEVVAGYPASADSFVTGDTVNTAARLEQNAPPGEVLLGAPTYRLVRDAVEVERVEPIAAKGKAEPVAAYRLVSVRPDAAGHARHLERQLVGRERELEQLRHEFDGAVAERVARLVTVLGTAGVGKSRLVAELVQLVARDAQVLKGRCLPYGEGITYWPIRELVSQAAGIVEADTSDAAKTKIRDLLAGEPEAELLARRVGTALGVETEPAPQEELFWAIRKLLEHLARERPAVLVIEDIHWAEPTLLDLFEYIVDLAADAPLLLVCPARPELLEKRPGWSGPSGTRLLRLEPLGSEATEQLIDETPGGQALPAGLRTRMLAAAEGNPLFVEELLAMLVDDGQLTEADGIWQAAGDLDALAIPLSIKALLAARIDGLPEAERRVAERASVVGRVFEAAAVRELADEGATDVGRNLLALVRKELVRPDRSELVAGDAFKFRHILIRDAAYEALPKAERATLHERFADWLVRVTGDRAAEYDEITGHHYAEAHRYRTELGESGEQVQRLADRAAHNLISAGKRSLDRGDMPAASDVLRRAISLLPPGDPRRLDSIPDLAFALFSAGSLVEAQTFLAAGVAEAEGMGNERAQMAARLETALIDMLANGTSLGQWGSEAREMLPRLEALDDQIGLARAWLVLAAAAWFNGRAADAVDARERGARHADLAGESRLARRVTFWGAEAYGSEPVSTALPRIESARALAAETNPMAEAAALFNLTALYAMTGDLDRAREARADMDRGLRDLGTGLWEAAVAEVGAIAEMICGQPKAAEALLVHTISMLERVGAKGYLATQLALLAVALSQQRRDAEAVDVAGQATAAGSQDDVQVHVLAGTARAASLARLGAVDDAVAAGEEAVRWAVNTDFLIFHADAEVALAEALDAAGRPEDAHAARGRAVKMYRAKGSTASVERMLARPTA